MGRGSMLTGPLALAAALVAAPGCALIDGLTPDDSLAGLGGCADTFCYAQAASVDVGAEPIALALADVTAGATLDLVVLTDDGDLRLVLDRGFGPEASEALAVGPVAPAIVVGR